MNNTQAASGAGTFLFSLFLGIIFDNVALGIVFGLLFGGGAAKVTGGK